MSKQSLSFNKIDLQAALDQNNLDLKQISKNDIAIIGMNAKFPKANNIDEYWQNLRNGVDCIIDFPGCRRQDIERFLEVFQPDTGGLKYRRGAYLEEIDKFDNSMFRLSPREASLMDPHQRLFLETAWGAMEDAGYGGKKLIGSKTGVYASFEGDQWYKDLIGRIEPSSIPVAWAGNIKSIVASRIAYLLDFRGPALLVDTSCSSSLVAIYYACQGIRNGESDLAIAGSVTIAVLPLESTQKFGIESSTGITRTFDDDADGTMFGEGVAAVLLKPLTNALRDGDHIYAVIKSVGINQDGASNGITAPNPEAQEELLAQTWEKAGINPETITYIEAHGTGTKIGDPIEVNAIQKAFQRFTTKKHFCGIGSVKSNIGHLDYTAGIAGFIKAVLALKSRELPPTLNFNNPNRRIDFLNSPVYVNDKLSKWETGDSPRRCGVSAFSMTGTNCHILLEETPEVRVRSKKASRRFHILALSAKSDNALKTIIERYLDFLQSFNETGLPDLCFTTNTGKGHYDYRLAIIVQNYPDLCVKLQKLALAEDLEKIVDENYIFYSKHRVVGDNAVFRDNGEITESELKDINNKAGEHIANIRDEEQWSAKLCQLYVKGGDIDWDLLYQGENMQRISLPIYPFERKRCWIALPDSKEISKRVEESIKDEFFYEVQWKQTMSPAPKEYLLNGAILIFNDHKEIGNRIAHELSIAGSNVIIVDYGAEYCKSTNNHYTISGAETDYQLLFSELAKENLTRILHLATIGRVFETENMADLEKAQVLGVESLLYIIQALRKNEINNDIELIIVAEYINEVTRKEKMLFPINTALYGLGKVVTMENLNLKTRCIDIDKYVETDELIAELKAGYNEYSVAYRYGERYSEEIGKVDLAKIPTKPIVISEDGVYVITGGTGRLGLEIGKYLAATKKVNLALISRSGLPERTEWEKIIASGEDQELSSKLNELVRIEEYGATVDYCRADVSISEEMEAVFHELRKKYGRINGIIHCAAIGVGKEGELIGEATSSSFRTGLMPKIQGTWLLDHLTQTDEMDFLILFSSAITTTGGFKSACYITGNSYLDTYTACRNKAGKRTLAINWPTWRNTVSPNEDTNKLMFEIIESEEAIEVFKTIIHKAISRLIIGKLNLDSKLFYLEKYLPFRLSPELRAAIESKNQQAELELRAKIEQPLADVLLKGGKSEDYSPEVKLIGRIWGTILGLSEIHIHENFYDLGGDSIIAMQIINYVNQEMQLNIGIAELFKFPTIEQFVGYIEEQYLTTRDRINRYDTLVPVDKQEYYPVTSAQKRMFFRSKQDGVGVTYNLANVYVIEGKFDKEECNEVFQRIVERHESFRTSFHMVKGELVQKVEDRIDFAIEFKKATEENIEQTIEEFIKPYYLHEAPLFRVCLIEISHFKHYLLLDIHHIIADWISFGILFRDFAYLYNRQELPELKVQYKDFSVWQNKFYLGDEIKEQENYWLRKFQRQISSLNLPYDYPRPSHRSFKGDQLCFELDPELTKALKELVKETKVTIYIALLAIFNVLLFKLSSQEDIIVGSPIAGRSHINLENIIGYFNNTLVMRNYPEKEMMFKDFLQDVSTNTLEAFSNQEYPFEELLAKLDYPQVSGRNPLFDVSFVFQGMLNIQNEYQIKDLKCEPYHYGNKTVSHDLLLEGVDRENHIELKFMYCTELFKRETIESLKNGFIHITREIVRDSMLKLAEIEISSLHEKVQSVAEFNRVLE